MPQYDMKNLRALVSDSTDVIEYLKAKVKDHDDDRYGKLIEAYVYTKFPERIVALFRFEREGAPNDGWMYVVDRIDDKDSRHEVLKWVVGIFENRHTHSLQKLFSDRFWFSRQTRVKNDDTGAFYQVKLTYELFFTGNAFVRLQYVYDIDESTAPVTNHFEAEIELITEVELGKRVFNIRGNYGWKYHCLDNQWILRLIQAHEKQRKGL